MKDINLKEFEASLKSVSHEEVLQKKVKGQYVPYIQAISKKARLVPVGRSIEVDMKEPKVASAMAMAIRNYLKKTSNDEFTAGNYRTFVFCGKRNGEPTKKGK